MRDQIEKYTQKLIGDRSAVPESIRFYALDDELIVSRDDEWRPVFEEAIDNLSVVGLLLAKPSLLFADFLIAKTGATDNRIYPRDSEIKTFLHDIPFIRKDDISGDLATAVINILKERKGLIIEGVGFVTSGTVTLEQAYIVYSSIFHATFIKYLYDLLESGFTLPGEGEEFKKFREGWLAAPNLKNLAFRKGPLTYHPEILDEIARVGRYTVEAGLVDSFFGNISLYHNGTVYISQTGSSLDELDGLIDPVPIDNSSTVGITASSELSAHRAIYEITDYKTILHGHPKFSVIISMLCDKRQDCDIVDCGKSCPETRMFYDIPIVSGEIGAGGLAKKVPPVIKEYGRALVYGHGPFCAGRYDFKGAFADLTRIEKFCREKYFEMLTGRLTKQQVQ